MKKVCLDLGHGGSDPGACANGLREADIALKIGMLVGGYLKAVGYDVVCTRQDDVDVAYPNASATEELQARCDVSDNSNADIFVSIHCNSFNDPAASGTETFYFSDNGSKLAQPIQRQLVNGLGLVDRGIKQSSGLYVLKHCNAVAALVEVGFLSNSLDEQILANDSGQDCAARAIARGITDYFQGV